MAYRYIVVTYVTANNYKPIYNCKHKVHKKQKGDF